MVLYPKYKNQSQRDSSHLSRAYKSDIRLGFVWHCPLNESTRWSRKCCSWFLKRPLLCCGIPSNWETGGQSNRQGRHRLYLWPDCFGFMWTPSNAPILSQPTLRSLSPYNLWQSTSLSFLPVPLFGWTAKAKSRGELILPLKMTPVPLHFLPRHCVLHGLYRGGGGGIAV